MGVVMASCSCLGPRGVPASLAAVQQASACSPAGLSRVLCVPLPLTAQPWLCVG